MSSTLGIIIGNRDFFPDHLITEARNEVLNIFKNKGLKPIILKDSDTKLGGVETFLEAQRCADLFKSHKDEIEGILIVSATPFSSPKLGKTTNMPSISSLWDLKRSAHF